MCSVSHPSEVEVVSELLVGNRRLQDRLLSGEPHNRIVSDFSVAATNYDPTEAQLVVPLVSVAVNADEAQVARKSKPPRVSQTSRDLFSQRLCVHWASQGCRDACASTPEADDRIPTATTAVGAPRTNRCERNRVNTQIQKSTAAQGWIMPPTCAHSIRIVGASEPKVCGHKRYVTESTVDQQLSDDVRLGQIPGPHRLHGEDSSLPRRMHDVASFIGGNSKWFLDQDMVSGRDGQKGEFAMFAMRCRNVDNIHVVVTKELCRKNHRSC